MSKKGKGSNYQWLFIVIVLLLYLLLYFIYPGKIRRSLGTTFTLFYNILPILIIVFVFMGLSNYFLSPKFISKYVGKTSGFMGWMISITAGIISHGPIYVWFPLLKDLKSHGMRDGLVAAFLYNRSIKLPLLPVMIYYFGWIFVVILMILMVLASFVEGKAIEFLENVKIEEK